MDKKTYLARIKQYNEELDREYEVFSDQNRVPIASSQFRIAYIQAKIKLLEMEYKAMISSS